jgi:hypothetical protein
MAAFGLTADDYTEEDFPSVLVWPGNERFYELWCLIGNQWRVAMNGPVALDQMPMRHQLDRMKLGDEEYDEYMNALRIMEAAALAEIHAG